MITVSQEVMEARAAELSRHLSNLPQKPLVELDPATTLIALQQLKIAVLYERELPPEQRRVFAEMMPSTVRMIDAMIRTFAGGDARIEHILRLDFDFDIDEEPRPGS